MAKTASGKRASLSRPHSKSPAEISETLKAFAKNAQLFSADQPRIISEHENKWVGVFDGKVAAVGDTLEEVIDVIESRGFPLAETMIRHVERKEKALIL